MNSAEKYLRIENKIVVWANRICVEHLNVKVLRPKDVEFFIGQAFEKDELSRIYAT